MQAYTLGQLSLLCEELLSLYGSVIKRVGSYLLRRGRRSLHDIRMATELKEADVTTFKNLSSILFCVYKCCLKNLG